MGITRRNSPRNLVLDGAGEPTKRTATAGTALQPTRLSSKSLSCAPGARRPPGWWWADAEKRNAIRHGRCALTASAPTKPITSEVISTHARTNSRCWRTGNRHEHDSIPKFKSAMIGRETRAELFHASHFEIRPEACLLITAAPERFQFDRIGRIYGRHASTEWIRSSRQARSDNVHA